ncbi:hypothetical protein ERJ75_000340900 [Trypanosoma vivax]|nr:hypothetical protein ERJ75_000340900 [Trypanosoma vivax]
MVTVFGNGSGRQQCGRREDGGGARTGSNSNSVAERVRQKKRKNNVLIVEMRNAANNRRGRIRAARNREKHSVLSVGVITVDMVRLASLMPVNCRRGRRGCGAEMTSEGMRVRVRDNRRKMPANMTQGAGAGGGSRGATQLRLAEADEDERWRGLQQRHAGQKAMEA